MKNKETKSGWFSTSPASKDADEVLCKLDDRLNGMIDRWAKREASSTQKASAKLGEILVFNTMMLYSDSKVATEFREFFTENLVEDRKNDLVNKRVEALYVSIMMAFPDWFIESKEAAYEDAIQTLGYTVNYSVKRKFPYGWLIHQIQHLLRYSLEIKAKQLP